MSGKSYDELKAEMAAIEQHWLKQIRMNVLIN